MTRQFAASTRALSNLGRDTTTKDSLDVFVGRRLRRRRIALGVSQAGLGEAVGVSFQQIQKYESGANRAVVRRLYEFARALDVPPAYFFDGYAESTGCGLSYAKAPEPAAPGLSYSSEETLMLVRAYHNVQSAPLRHEILRMIIGLDGM